MNHESKCANLHGHNYVAWFDAEADQLDDIGRIIDFSVLKEKIGGWIDTNWDHTTILFEEDINTIEAVERCQENKPVFISTFNPTAEEMASFLLNEICPEVLKGSGVRVTRVRIYETENCLAEAIQS